MKKNVAVVAGGFSGEHGISLKSAGVVMESLDPAIFNPYLVVIDKSGWYHQDKSGNKYPVDKNDFSIEAESTASSPNQRVNFEVVFISIHGTPGEDGKLQGYFEMLGLPITSCNSITSALTFNKSYCNKVVDHFGVVNVSKSVHLVQNNKDLFASELEPLKYPVFVKPNCGGSSVGMSKVHDPGQVWNAVDLAFKEDTEVLVEEYIKGREMTCGVLSYKGEIIVFPVTEIISKKEFFDFEAKYDPDLADEIVPAQIPGFQSKTIQDTSVQLFRKLNCNGVVRFDYILCPEGSLWFLEVNSVPGMTRESIVPKQARSHGMSITELFTMMIEDALWRKNRAVSNIK